MRSMTVASLPRILRFRRVPKISVILSAVRRRALQRRLQTLAGDLENGARSFDPGIVLKPGATLVRQWRGHTHTVLVREDGFEYDGRRYRSLTVIAERITGAHWSGPRFFGVSKRTRAP